MLRGALSAIVSFVVLFVLGSHAYAQDEKDGLRRPERLTVGVADQFVGQLAPDHKTLYFATNRNTTNEIYSQNIADGRAKILFDEGADVTWPRVSPDGKSILYISYSDRATGQLCVRELPKGEDRKCLAEPSAALLAEWIDDHRIALVSRATIDGNLRLLEVDTKSKLASRVLFERNITSPTVSPDGRWIVYVPLERSTDRVGPAFAAHAAQHLEAVRIDVPGEPVRIPLDVPGLTGQPAFSKDGKFLYFVQFFADSNHDGVVDGSDHGVLFRIPITLDGSGPPTAGLPKQISDETWNCQYPSPARDLVLSTCSRGKNLDMYSLPLDGEVPSEWTMEHLADEIELASTYEKQQLLYYERLAKVTEVEKKRFIMVRLVRIHLALEAFDAAEHYAKRIEGLGDAESVAIAKPLKTLIEHRKALKERERGRIVEAFDERAHARLDTLKVGPNDAPAAVAMTRLVRSEIFDSIGDKKAARTELETAPIVGKTPRSVLQAFYERADAMYRELDDREALITSCKALALHDGLAADDRLRYARAAVRAMMRGLPVDEAEARLTQERTVAPPDSELAFAIDLGKLVAEVHEAKTDPAVKKAITDLYDSEKRVDRRRAIMVDATERANRFGADSIIEGLAEHYVQSVGPTSPERRRAERLYTRVIVGRAFRRRAAERWEEARVDFEAVAKRTGSLEAVVGAIDVRTHLGEKPAAIRADYQSRTGDSAATLAHFVTAYTISRELVTMEGEAHAKAAVAATNSLMASWSDLKKECMAQALYGAILHEEYLRTNELGAAEKASTHYLVALELVADNPRYKAMVLGQLGLLHTQVGNYRIALGYLNDRDKLPYTENSEGLAVRLAQARSLLHIGEEKEAATRADEALAMIVHQPKLAPYKILALDRAALYNLAANKFPEALKHFDEELPLLEKDNSLLGRRNRFVAHLARAAAALGANDAQRATTDLDEVDREVNIPALASSLAWPHATNEQVVRTYRLMLTGLRARAADKLGQLDVAAKALEARRSLLQDGLKAADRGEYIRMLALADAQLAENAAARKDQAGTSALLKRALETSDSLKDRGRGLVDSDQLDVLWLAAETTVQQKTPAPSDLPQRLGQARELMDKDPSPAYRSYEAWFEIYQTLTGPLAPADPEPPASAPGEKPVAQSSSLPSN